MAAHFELNGCSYITSTVETTVETITEQVEDFDKPIGFALGREWYALKVEEVGLKYVASACRRNGYRELIVYESVFFDKEYPIKPPILWSLLQEEKENG